MTEEHKLIERAQEGDHEAFCSLARSYQRRIYALALHYTRDPHEAEDLSQEVWLKAYKSLGGFRGEAGFYTWLRRITINTFLNHQREMKTMYSSGKKAFRLGELVSLDELGLTPAAARHAPEERLQQQMMVEKVMEGLSELTAQQRLIFLLKHREGMTYDEIAQACEVSTGTVKKALFRAINRLREYLGVKSDDYAQLCEDKRAAG
ncbi:MAG TPA: sigma-70 family RNA polymerase sigma factor [Blastocatellia bacterium]|nr:sigma-70 family RNA polymerase sigma factor [Blastocatellia bacterium]